MHSVPEEALLCGNHRELYYAHRDATKCQHNGCYGLGIELTLKDWPVMECRDRLKSRVISQNVTPADSLSQGASSEMSARSTCGESSGPSVETPVSRPVPTAPSAGPIDSPSSSGLSIPDLIACAEDGSTNATDDASSASVPPVAHSFAQNVRADLESLSSKGESADLPQRVRRANQEINADGEVVDSGKSATQSNVGQSVDSLVAHGIQNTPLSVDRVECPANVDVSNSAGITPDQNTVSQMKPSLHMRPTEIAHQPQVGVAAEQMPGLEQRPLIANITVASNLDDLDGVEGLMPRFIRRRSAPAGHQVVSDEVDAEMYEKADGDILRFKDLSAWSESEKDENKDDPWTRLNESATFAMCGFVQFSASLAVGVYSKERKSTLLRQGLTERDMLRDQGARAPIGTRISHAAAALQWGSLSSEGIPGETLLVGDFTPWTQDAYDKYQPDAKKNEARRKQTLSIEKFAKASKQHTMAFGLLRGKGNCEERISCLMELGRVRESRPELFTVDFATDAFEEVNPHYIAQIKEGARNVIRMGSGGVGKPSIARIALNIADGKGPRWEYTATFLTRRPAGMWLARIIPKLGEKRRRLNG